MENINDYRSMIDDAELVLVGIGEEFEQVENAGEILNAYNNIANILEGKNYFVVSACENGLIFNSKLNSDKITAPFCDFAGTEEQQEKQWGNYTLWLSCTLNRKLLVIELGASINKPQLMRWPFEKTVELNNKATMLRVNDFMPNVPKEISEKSHVVKGSSIEFCLF